MLAAQVWRHSVPQDSKCQHQHGVQQPRWQRAGPQEGVKSHKTGTYQCATGSLLPYSASVSQLTGQAYAFRVDVMAMHLQRLTAKLEEGIIPDAVRVCADLMGTHEALSPQAASPPTVQVVIQMMMRTSPAMEQLRST